MGDHLDNAVHESRGGKLYGFVLRLTSMGVLWGVLVHGELSASWMIGAPTVALALWASYRLTPRPGGRVRLWGALRFVPYFIRKSLIGGIDVGLRALRPSMPLRPGLVRYEVKMRPEVVATIVFVGVISLLPGTLCASLEGGVIEVHVIDRTKAIDEQLAELEARVAQVFGESLQSKESQGEAG